MLKLGPNILHCVASFVMAIGFCAATTCSAAAGDCFNPSIKVTDRSKDSVAGFYLTAKDLLEATLVIDFEHMENIKASRHLPYEFKVDGPCKNKLLMYVSRVREEPWHYRYSYRFKLGIKSDKKTDDYVYSLPYAASKHFVVCQGPGGAFSHGKGSRDEYAVDFRMPLETEVLAARPGKVIGFRSDSSMGGQTKDCNTLANYVVVKHDDGTYGFYAHLKHDGVLVKLGQIVKIGTPLGLSGATGRVKEPCLHFSVYRLLEGTVSTTLPYKIRTPKGILNALKQGETY